MSIEDILFYRNRWRAVEAIERQERLAATLDLRWKQLNALVGIGKGSDLLRPDASEAGVQTRWVAHRPKDLLDIHAIANNHPDMDRQRIEEWVRQFAEVLDLPELWDEISRLL